MRITKRTTSVPELLLAIGRDAPMPLRVQLERELRTAIQTGRLRQEMPLPSSRALAADLSSPGAWSSRRTSSSWPRGT